jgi:biopolymer transport protein TolR
MAMQIGSRGPLRAEMNVTPMIDVLLVLLVIFILINPAKKVGMEAQLPQENPRSDGPPPERTIVVEVVATDDPENVALRINSLDVPAREFEARIKDIYKTRVEKVMFLQADDGLEFARVADVMDSVRNADPAVRVGLMTTHATHAD